MKDKGRSYSEGIYQSVYAENILYGSESLLQTISEIKMSVILDNFQYNNLIELKYQMY